MINPNLMMSESNSIRLQDRLYVMVMSLGIFAFFALLIIQFYRLQVVQGKIWEKRAERQHRTIVREPFRRGRFWSFTSLRADHPSPPFSFVIDRPVFHLNVDPESIPSMHRNDIAGQLQQILQLSPEEYARFRKQFDYTSRYRRLYNYMTSRQWKLIQEWWTPWARQAGLPQNALFYEKDYERSYPSGQLLGQVLHTVRRKRDGKTGQAIPTGGLEESLNDYLKGTFGQRLIIRSVRQHSIGLGEEILSPEDGADVHLSINHYIQAIAEEELAKGMEKAQAKRGWAVMMDPHTGEILALAQYPFFFPEKYEEYYGSAETIDHTKIYAIHNRYEPGSIIKPVTLAICLQANEELERQGKPPFFTPEEKIATGNGYFRGRSRIIKEYSGRYHSYLNMYHALQHSSNVYVSRLIERLIETLGEEWYHHALYHLFQFGKATGIEMKGEEKGFLPRLHRTYSHSSRPEWSKDTPYSLAFGHNLEVNSIQILRAFSMLANGGKLVRPTLVRKIIDTNKAGEERILVDNTTKEYREQFPQVLSKSVTEKVVQAMRYMSLHGRFSNVYGYTEAGKSGTARKVIGGLYSSKSYFSSFVSIVPALSPRFVLLVSLDEPSMHFIPGVGRNYYGGTCAAPIATAIATRALEYLGIPPDDPHGYPKGDPRHDKEKTLLQKELDELNALYREWNEKKE